MTATTTVPAWTYRKAGYPTCLEFTTSNTVATQPPSETHIVIKPHAASLNPVDIQLMNLESNNDENVTNVAGRDFAGVVLAAGPQSGFDLGDEVMGINMGHPGPGFLAEIVCLDVHPKGSATVVKKPKNLDWVQAASLPCVWLTAMTCVEMCVSQVSSGSKKIAVLGGSSSTGIYTVKLAKRKGWTVLSSCSGRNVDFVKSLGADQVVDYTTSPTAVVDAVRSFRPDAIVDCVGGTDTIGLAPKYVTIVGDKTSRDTMGGAALYKTNWRMWLRWLWGYVGLGNSYDCIILEGNPDNLRQVESLKADEVIIDSVFEFEKVKEAFERLDTGRARGKVVVKVVD